MRVPKIHNRKLYSRIARLLFIPVGLISPLMGASYRTSSVARVLHASKFPAEVSNQYRKEGMWLLKEAPWTGAVGELKERLSYDPKSEDAYVGLGVEVARSVAEDHPSDAVGWYHLGRTLSEKGDFDGAIDAFENALKLQPDLHEGYHSLGLSLRQKAAANRAQPSSAVSPNNSFARQHYQQGSDFLSHGNLQEAEKELQMAADAEPDYAEAQNLLGAVLGQEAKLPAALEHLNRAVHLKPEFAAGHYDLGAALWYSGDEASALSELESAQRLDPASWKMNAFLGMVLQETGQLDRARRYLQRTIALNPNVPSPYVDLGVVFLKMDKLESGLTQFGSAINILTPEGPVPDVADAVAELRRAIARNPRVAESHNILGRLLGIQGLDSQVVLSEFREAIRLRPDFAEAHNNEGLVLTQEGRIEEAIGAYRDAIRYQHDDADAHANLGTCLIERNVDEAIHELQTAIQIQPNLIRAHYSLALAYGRQQGPEKEIEQLRKVIAFDPNFAQAHATLGKTLLSNGEIRNAITELRQAVELNPKLGEAHYQLGMALARAGEKQNAAQEVEKGRELISKEQDLDKATSLMSQAIAELNKGELNQASADFEKVIRLQPDYPEAHFNLGQTLLKEGDIEGAIREFRRAHELQPASYSAAYSLGQVLLKKGSFDEAIAMFRSALRVRPSSAEAYNQLGQALVANGDRDGAAASFRKALQIDPSYSAARQSLQVGFNEPAPLETTSAEPRGAAPPNANLPRAGAPSESENHPPPDSTENFDLMIQKGQLSMVEPRLVSFLRDHPDSSRAHYQLGYVWLRQRRISDSIREFSRSLQLNLDFADAHRLLGLDLSLIGRYEAAQLELQQSVRLEPNSAEAHYELGKICAARDLWPQAAQEFKEAIRLNASYAEAYNALGFALDALNDDEAALSSYQKAIHLSQQRERKFVAPYINLSAYYNRIGNADLALQYAQTAIKLDEKSDLAYFQMAKAFRFREEWSEAAEALRTAIAINSNSPQYYYVLSSVETKLGHQKESQEAIRTFKKLEDDMASRSNLRRESLEGVFDRRNGETN